ncbi:hypothetical protein [uncultured Pontibacter sp.]|uniref:hypothetical protein n=1 Tax=uncultured Pontibacter sp. TaxID=453356 RepID=UPI0026351106|nr:hypothetical protein [uncultured Pontibacter sp.]
MKLRLILTLYLFTLVACSQRQEEQYQRLEQGNAVYDPSNWVKADLQCEEIQSADEGDPLAVVYLSQLEMQHVLDTVYTCSVIAPQMYTSFGVPRHALSACGGWWAGRGNFYYALHEGDSIAVMHARPVQGDTVEFEYKLLKNIPISSPQE